MVVNRFIEAFSPDSEEERMQVLFTDGNSTFTWKACRQISLGWKAVQKDKATEAERKEGDDEQALSSLPNLAQGEVLTLLNAEITEHKTKPKPLYTEAALLSAMENAGKEVEDAESKKAMAECGISAHLPPVPTSSRHLSSVTISEGTRKPSFLPRKAWLSMRLSRTRKLPMRR